MSAVPSQFKLALKPLAAQKAMIHVGQARFTILTDRLIRLEYHPEGCFEDRASQAFWYREQPVPAFTTRRDDTWAEIETSALVLRYRCDTSQGFQADTLSIRLKDSGVVWHYGDKDSQNLRSTNRTLDFANGYEALNPGLMSRSGWSVIDDSTSLVINQESWLEPRISGGLDLYFLGYGADYRACLRDYCKVSGAMSLIPRWALGNWWSRYWAYSQADLTQLLNDFESHDLPFSVCIIDMDWHITKTGNTSSGWTGYTWNRELFPDPQGFIDLAHGKNLKISMNLHPADGVHPHEEQYPEMARRIGIDPATGEPVKFNITDPTFADAYFEVLHRPHEKMGVDFWWVDWQQGQKSNLPGLDPLWLINHLHYYDQGRNGKRPFVFSRWGNEGHQRYPIGFSGDSYATWATLNFQPYMTATSANIGYGWWSHDIGGHTSGTENPELLARWVQVGVFSPINRIHSTSGYFYDRRPWLLENAEVETVLRDALQLRHAFVPYIYTMARRAYTDSQPLMQPMYYDYPAQEEAYHCSHQYLFGSELLAAPFVSPADSDTNFSRQVVWLPDGVWTNVFTGEQYQGGKWHAIYGRLADIPLFAKAGAILPLADQSGRFGTDNPESLNVHIFGGADGAFDLYEDDGDTTGYLDGVFCLTPMRQTTTGDEVIITIGAPEGDTALIPATRFFKVIIHGITVSAPFTALVNGSAISPDSTYDAETETLHIAGIALSVSDSLRIQVSKVAFQTRDRKRETVLRLLRHFRLHTGVRNRIAQDIDAILQNPEKLALYLLPMANSQARALFEVLYEAGVHYIADTHHPDLILMWNNREDSRITYRYADAYLWFGGMPSANHQHGIVPKFATFTPPVHQWSHGSNGRHVQRTQWSAQIDYLNLLTVLEQHLEVSP